MRKYIAAVVLLIAAAAVFTQVAAKEPSNETAIGKPVPKFTLEDQNGKTVALDDYKGKIVVLEWFNEQCPFVEKHYSTGHMNMLAQKYVGSDVAWLLINSSHFATNDSNLRAAK